MREKKWSRMLHKIHSRGILFHAKHKFMLNLLHSIIEEFLFMTHENKFAHIYGIVQLNKYEIAPYFVYQTKNLHAIAC